MKKIFTLIIAAISFTASFAQSHKDGNSRNKYQTDNRYSKQEDRNNHDSKALAYFNDQQEHPKMDFDHHQEPVFRHEPARRDNEKNFGYENDRFLHKNIRERSERSRDHDRDNHYKEFRSR